MSLQIFSDIGHAYLIWQAYSDAFCYHYRIEFDDFLGQNLFSHLYKL